MTKKKWITITVCLAAAVFGALNFTGRLQMIPTAKKSPVIKSKAQNLVARSRQPQYVSVYMKSDFRTLVAGETGSFELEARLNTIENTQGGPLVWNTDSGNGVIVWIASPKNSGIAFFDKTRPDKPLYHMMVKFSVPDGNTSDPLTTWVEYIVDSKTKAGQHTLWLDIFSELTTVTGDKIYDAGVARVPFEVDTHLFTKLLMLFVVAFAIVLFIFEWVRVDVVGILMMVMLPELGLIRAEDTFRGISSNAVISIIGVMIISYGLNRAGLVNRLIQPLLSFVGNSSSRLVVSFCSLIALISSVMQNTGAAVLFLPAIRLVASHRLKIHVSRVLMPIGMAAILGGTLTMIGTSPLILLNDILPPGMAKFGFLELTPIGLSLVIGGIAYLATFGLGMLEKKSADPANLTKTGRAAAGDSILRSYPGITGPYEIFIPRDYHPGEGPQKVVDIRQRFLVNIVASAKGDAVRNIVPLPGKRIQPGFALCAYGPEKEIRNFIRDYGLVFRKDAQRFKDTMFNPAVAGIVEAVVSPRSSMIGQTIKEIRFRETFGITALAIHQAGTTYYRELADRPLQSGDTVLIQGTWKQFHALQDLHQNFIIISPFEEEFHKPEKANWALTCFLTSLFLMILSSFYFQSRAYNPIPLSVCLMVGALGMIVTKVITISEAYRTVDWRTVFLLGGLIPLGIAVDQTGTAQWIAKGVVLALGSLMSPLVLLIVLAVLSCGFTMVISNVGACALLVPLAISLASQIGIDPRVAAIVVGIGVSNSFILPTHQVNALYMGPGEYRTKDYIKIGGFLSVIYIAILVTIVYIFYL
ncbi:MAG: anion permease [Desulfobacula sp.]|nr:anion permease [Desulfobacula sp.]